MKGVFAPLKPTGHNIRYVSLALRPAHTQSVNECHYIIALGSDKEMTDKARFARDLRYPLGDTMNVKVEWDKEEFRPNYRKCRLKLLNLL